MNIPINKNRSWIAQLHKGIDQMDERTKAAIMRPAGISCASDLLSLCQKYLDKKIESIEDLVTGWNIVREKRHLMGKWVLEGKSITGVFSECGCPLRIDRASSRSMLLFTGFNGDNFFSGG